MVAKIRIFGDISKYFTKKNSLNSRWDRYLGMTAAMTQVPVPTATRLCMIKDELKERGMTQKQLAAETGIKPSVLSETINGKRSVSLNVAVALEKALGISADIWMNMQTQYDLDTANIAERDNQRETVAVTIPMRDRNLLQELVRKFGWACVF